MHNPFSVDAPKAEPSPADPSDATAAPELPTVGRIVHVLSGAATGSGGSTCLAAIVTGAPIAKGALPVTVFHPTADPFPMMSTGWHWPERG